jgi:hypothetical protein
MTLFACFCEVCSNTGFCILDKLVARKTDIAMVNETLCKILCHNLVVIIHEMRELGIEPVFWSNAA